MILNMSGGGGAGGLNFRVLGGTSAPYNAKENDIWVNSPDRIPAWAFTNDAPDTVTVPCESDVHGYHLTATGGQGGNIYLNITKYTKIPAGATKITTTNHRTTAAGYYHAFYNENKELISTVERKNDRTEYDVPYGATYVRLSVVDDDPFEFIATVGAENGFVWFAVGESSTVAFNALKKNRLDVFPISAKQYVDGEWVGVSAYFYRAGEWVQFSKEFDGYLFNNGSVNEDITGGWSASDGAVVSNTLFGDYYSYPSTKGATCGTVKKVDLTEYNTIKVNCTKLKGTGVLSIGTDTNEVATKSFTTTGVTELNISAVSGEHYIRISSSGASDGDYTVDKVWLE